MSSLFRKFAAPTTEATKEFYANISSGAVKRGMWGKEKRFDPFRVGNTANIDRHFVAKVGPHISGSDIVLDFGCGPGVFLLRMAAMCARIIGVDISRAFIDTAANAARQLHLNNIETQEIDGASLNYEDSTFDKVVLVDVIHHLENIDVVMNELRRVLKPNGKLLVFEPNKLNPALLIMCLLDRNEWGLLPLGTRKAYERLFQHRFKIEHFEFCGLLIGPDSKWAFAVANFLLTPPFANVFRFLSPKVFIVATPL